LGSHPKDGRYAYQEGVQITMKAIEVLSGFKRFILRGNVVDLAVGVVVGASFNNVVQALVKDLLTPLIAAIAGEPDFSNLYFTLNNSKFQYGDLLNQVISFLLISAAVYFLVITPINSLVSRMHKAPPAEPNTKKCPECTSEIPKEAKRCKYCTSQTI